VIEYRRDGTQAPAARQWVPEAPVALEYNGIAYAVMMATPADLEDFAVGFALAEGLAAHADEVSAITVAEVAAGWVVRASLAGPGAAKITERVRARVAESSCGLCGMENLAEVARPLPPVPPHGAITPTAIFAALDALRPLQTLGRATGAAHATAFASPEGAILALREDVGRHNAMDKLVGALARASAKDTRASAKDARGNAQEGGHARGGQPLAPGFVLSTARCSYEIVEKAVRGGAGTLVTISLPTSMAVARARAAGLSLWGLARDDSVLCVHRGAA